MKNSFKCYIDSATAQKKLFDESIDNVKGALVKVVSESMVHSDSEMQVFKKQEPAYSTTGWLKGALSYPWAIVSIVIPSILENL
ncbi:hypothetical protein [Fibrobacter sp. UWB13]|jgi:hypothetical protein|uniref:hypothetical protein n=1 Tax=Fibrobacter sp. UWB13 TaxID=1896204 RepID=UPI000A0E0329|nr:hypothetical protein [Fibrobacter sp. UWB13]MBQ3778790.1 hypothetical protein [Fibrobacter sp.]SMG41410.1 hypothetical protein SAMN05720489_2883 [Fibrobacter sp. UWB13]